MIHAKSRYVNAFQYAELGSPCAGKQLESAWASALVKVCRGGFIFLINSAKGAFVLGKVCDMSSPRVIFKALY